MLGHTPWVKLRNVIIEFAWAEQGEHRMTIHHQQTKNLFLIDFQKLDGLIQFHTMFLRLFPLSICSSFCPEGVLPNLLTTESDVQHQLLSLALGILSNHPGALSSYVHICSSQIVVSLRDELPPLATVEQVMS